MSDELTTAEDSVIGAILLTGGKALDELTLTHGDFWTTRAGAAYEVATRLRRQGKPADVVTVSTEAKADPATARLIEDSWLHHVAQTTPTAANVGYYAEIVQTEALRRRMREAAQKVHQLADHPDPTIIVDSARAAVDQAAFAVPSKLIRFGELMDQTIDDLSKPPDFAPGPWASLNRIIDGFRPGCVYIVGARPGVGKTVFALQLALKMTQHGAVAFSSLEMSSHELVIRALAQDLRIDVSRLMRHNLTESDWGKVSERRAKFDQLPLHIDDVSARSISDIRNHVRDVARTGKMSAVVVDYLQLISAPRGTRMDRYEIVTDVSRELKLLAKEFRVPVIALSQLNRASAGRADGKPTITDLRESGAIEQDADVVILLHRDLADPLTAHQMTMIVAKNRHGESHSVDVEFMGRYSQIREIYTGPMPGIGNPFPQMAD